MEKKRILLADDDADDRLIFGQAFLNRQDIRLLGSVENGIEVLSFLNKMDKDSLLPDLIVLDQNMPKMNGKQTLAQLKSHDRFSNIPVIIYSTYNDDNFIDECKEMGALHIASKPSTFEEYNEMIENFINKI